MQTAEGTYVSEVETLLLLIADTAHKWDRTSQDVMADLQSMLDTEQDIADGLAGG